MLKVLVLVRVALVVSMVGWYVYGALVLILRVLALESVLLLLVPSCPVGLVLLVCRASVKVLAWWGILVLVLISISPPEIWVVAPWWVLDPPKGSSCYFGSNIQPHLLELTLPYLLADRKW